MFVAIRTSRRSSRSTNTPASAENSTAGSRNVKIRALTAVVEPVDSAMMTVRPKMTMFPPIWVAAWASQRSRNGRFLKTASAPSSGAVVAGAVPPAVTGRWAAEPPPR